MADSVTTQVLHSGSRHLLVKLTGVSDGTGESLVTKIHASDYGCTGVAIRDIQYNIKDQEVDLFFGATTPALIGRFTSKGGMSYRHAPVANNAGAGKTGDILLTTVGAIANSSYIIVLDMIKSGVTR